MFFGIHRDPFRVFEVIFFVVVLFECTLEPPFGLWFTVWGKVLNQSQGFTMTIMPFEQFNELTVIIYIYFYLSLLWWHEINRE